MKSFIKFMEQKSVVLTDNISDNELSAQITEAAFNTSALLQEIGHATASDYNYRNVFVTHPSVEDTAEDAIIPDSTVQSYSTTVSDFNKISSSIALSQEVLSFSDFDIMENTRMLVGKVHANKVASDVVADIELRLSDAPATLEEVKRLKSGVSGFWGSTPLEIYDFISSAVKEIQDVYDSNSKLFCNKNNLVLLSSLVQDSDQVWVVQNGLLAGRYEIVVTDQLDDNTMYFGDLESAFDVVSLAGNVTVDPVTVPDATRITTTAHYSNTAKDTKAIVVMKAEV